MDIKGFKDRDGSVHHYDYTALANIPENGTVTDQQIAAAVEKYLTENPVDGVTDQQIYDAVTEYLTENPVEGVTDEQIAQAVADYLVKNPVEVAGVVKSVNGVEPDETGNVEITIPDSGGNVDLTGYATEQYVQEYAQPKGEYLTEVPEDYAKTEDIPTKPEDIGAQPAGNYLTEVPSGYATEEFVKNKIAEAELGGEEVDLSGYAQKSELPTKVSQLQNDSGYLTEHQDISGKLDASALPTAINTALAQAKASGEFDGYSPVRGKDYWTDADKLEIKSYVDDAILGGAW